jgi:hypothetical protein
MIFTFSNCRKLPGLDSIRERNIVYSRQLRGYPKSQFRQVSQTYFIGISPEQQANALRIIQIRIPKKHLESFIMPDRF